MTPDREALRRALELRSGQWRDILRGKHVEQGRLVLQHLVNLPIRIMNEPRPSFNQRDRAALRQRDDRRLPTRK